MSECSICGEEPEQHQNSVCSHCLRASSTVSSKAKTFQSVVKSMSERKSVEAPAPRAPDKVTVHSRQYRDKLCELSAGVYLRFDETGHARMDAHLVPQLQAFMRYKPGRLRIVSEKEELVEVEIFVGEDEPEVGVPVDIIVGEDPADALELFFGEEPENKKPSDKKNKKDKKKSSSKKKS